MKVRSEARVAGSSQLIGVELEDHDMADVAGWTDMSPMEKWRTMTQRADLLVVEYMVRNGFISQEYAAQRIQEIKSK